MVEPSYYANDGSDREFLVFVAIDLGTTYSGFAFAMVILHSILH